MLSYQLEYSAWANGRALDAARQLTPEQCQHDFKSSEHSILGTLVHIYRADRIWLLRLHGHAAEFVTPGDDTMAALSENWPPLSSAWVDWAKNISDSSAEMSYQDLRGNPWTQPIWQVVHHVVNHATHHRGQAIGFMRALGQTPPGVDAITFARQRA